MKVVSWNCAGAFRRKYHHLDRYNADVLIVQECEDPERAGGMYRDWAENYLWHGTTKNKGIGVFAKPGYTLERLPWIDDSLELFLPCQINGNLLILAVWTKYAKSPNFGYIGQLWKYLQAHGWRLDGAKAMVVGDLNSNTRWDEWDRWWNHSDVVGQLYGYGFQSLYHAAYGEEQGDETTPTLFHQRNPQKPYHVDYAFISTDLIPKGGPCVTVGEREDWLTLSDHMPLAFDVHYEFRNT